MTVSRLEKQLKDAQERLKKIVAVSNMDEYLPAHAAVLALERKLAAERMDEYADTLDFPVRWDVGAPMPHLIAKCIFPLARSTSIHSGIEEIIEPKR